MCHNVDRMPIAILMPRSIWFIVIMRKSAAYTSKKTTSYMLMVIADSIQMILIATNYSSYIR